MKISRQVGTTNQILQVYVQDTSVSTGAGLANVLGSTVSYSWFRNNQSAVSSGVASTAGAMGVYSTSAWVQLSSSLALGWYQFGAPDGVFVSGDSVGIHFYVSSGPNTIMAPLPLEIELTKTNNQQYASSTVFSSTQVVSSVSGSVNSVIGTTTVNVIQILGRAAVTSASGILNVSTQAIDKGGYGVTTVAADVIDAASLNSSAVNKIAATVNTSVVAESYRANGSAGSMVQLMYEVVAHMGESAITGVTKAIRQIDHTATAATFTLDSSSAPTQITRAT